MTLIQIKTWAHFESFLLKNKQDMYTMDPGRQIHLSNNNKNFWSKMIFEQNQKHFPEKFFSEKNLGKTEVWGKNV